MAKPLYVVVGGELADLSEKVFRDPSKVHVVGVFPYDEARNRWRGAAQLTVDNALMRYFIVPLDIFGEYAPVA